MLAKWPYRQILYVYVSDKVTLTERLIYENQVVSYVGIINLKGHRGDIELDRTVCCAPVFWGHILFKVILYGVGYRDFSVISQIKEKPIEIIIIDDWTVYSNFIFLSGILGVIGL